MGKCWFIGNLISLGASGKGISDNIQIGVDKLKERLSFNIDITYPNPRNNR